MNTNNNIISMEWELQRQVLWLNGLNYLVNGPIPDANAVLPAGGIGATRGYVSKKNLFCQVEFEDGIYTALSGLAENTKGDLLRFKIKTYAGYETANRLRQIMSKLYQERGGIVVELISKNEWTYRIVK